MKKRGKKLAYLVVAKPAGNIPRMLNLAQNLRAADIRLIHVGRRTKGDPKFIRKGRGAWVLNIDLVSSKIPFDFVRQPLILLEFLLRMRSAVRKQRPDFLFTFYNTAAALHWFSFDKSIRKIAWLLDFRHPYFLKLSHRFHEWIGELGWQHAHALIVPTRERLALHLGRRPQCMAVPSFIIHNAPNAPAEADRQTIPARNSGDPLKIIYAGGVGLGYGLPQIIDAVGNSEAHVVLHIVGRKRFADADSRRFQPDQQELKDQMDAVAHPEKISWDDAVRYEQLGPLLISADVGYVTYEGRANLNDRFAAPGKAYDYLGEGLVLLTDEAIAIGDLLNAADCAVMVPAPVTAESLRSAIEKLVERRGEITAMRNRALGLFHDQLCFQKQLRGLFSFLGIKDTRTETATPEHTVGNSGFRAS